LEPEADTVTNKRDQNTSDNYGFQKIIAHKKNTRNHIQRSTMKTKNMTLTQKPTGKPK
jgi:hypothetical protein